MPGPKVPGLNSVSTTPERSALMGRVRQSGTAAEMAVRRILFRLGARYRVNVRGLPGRPDVANKGRKKALFVHGCFWHHHKGCERARVPSRNERFWAKKFAANAARDRRNVQALMSRGFQVLVVWECELDQPEILRARLAAFWNDPETTADD